MAFKSFVSDSLIAVMEVLFDSLVIGDWVPNNFSPPNPVEIYNNMNIHVIQCTLEILTIIYSGKRK